MKMQGLHPVFRTAMAPFLAQAQAAPAIRDLVADEAEWRQRRLAEVTKAVADAARYNPTSDMLPVVAAVAACEDTPSLIRVAGALLQAIAAKGWATDHANMMWGGLQDVIDDLQGLCEREADEADAERLSRLRGDDRGDGGCEFDEVPA